MRIRLNFFVSFFALSFGTVMAETIYFENATDFDPGYINSVTGGTYSHGAVVGAGNPTGGGVRISTTNKGSHASTRVAANADLGSVRTWQTSILVNLSTIGAMSDGKGEVRFGIANGATIPSSDKQKIFESNSNDGFSFFVKAEHKPGESGKDRKIEFGMMSWDNGKTEVKSPAVQPAAYFNHWIRCTLTVNRKGPGGAYVVEYQVEDLGPDGTAAPIVVVQSTSPVHVTNTDFAAATTVHAIFAGIVEKNGAAISYDDHTFTATRSVPDAPSSLTATSVGEETATVNWAVTSGPGATSQTLELSTGDFEPDSFVSTTGETGQSAGFSVTLGSGFQTFTGLVGGTTYMARIRATNDEGEGPWSDVLTFTTPVGNTEPTIDAIPPTLRLSPTTTSRVINLSGITPGAEPAQTVQISATSDNPSVLPDPNVNYTVGSTGTLTLNPTGTLGSATVTLTLDDGQAENNLTSVPFTVNVEEIPATFDFSEAGEFSDLENKKLNVNPAWGSNFGIGEPSGGGISLGVLSGGSDSGWLAWRPEPFSVAGASYIETSLLFNLREWNDGGEEKGEIILGLSGDPTQADNSKPWEFIKKGTNTRGLGVKLKAEHKPTDLSKLEFLEVSIQNKQSSSETDDEQKLDLAGAPYDHWMKLTLVLVPNGATTFAVSYRVEDLGPSGTDTPTTVLAMTSPVTLTNAALAGDTTVYPAFAVKPDKANTKLVYLDNHHIEVQSGPPAAPTALSAATVTASAFSARWSPPAVAYVTGYVLEASPAADNFGAGTFLSATGSAGQSEGIAISDPGTTNLRLTGLLPGTEYRYRVRAVGPLGQGNPSNVIDTATLADGENADPTLNPISDTIVPPSESRVVPLTGISDGGEGDQILQVTAASDNEALVPAPIVDYLSPAAAGTLTISPLGPEGTTGTATITVTVSDGVDSVEEQFVVTVDEIPTINPFDSEEQFTSLKGHFLRANPTWGAALGAGNPASGGISVGNTSLGSDSGWLAWRDEPFSVPGASFLKTSLLFNPREWNDGGERKGEIILGFSGDPSLASASKPWEFIKKGDHTRGIGVKLKLEDNDSDKNEQLEISLQNKSGSSETDDLSKVSVNAAPYDHWMRLNLILVPNGLNTFAATYFVEDLGPDGTDSPTVILERSTPVTLTNASFAADTEVYPAFAVKPDKNNPARLYLDDHVSEVESGPPGAPLSLSATMVTSGAFTANWEAPSASFPTGYLLEVSRQIDDFTSFLSQNGETGQLQGIVIEDPSVTSLRITGLLPGGPYRYRVRAVGVGGTSQPSNVTEVTTLAVGVNAPPTLDDPAPAGVIIDPSRSRVVDLTGITDGGEGNQTIVVTAVSNNPAVLPNPLVSYTTPSSVGQLTLMPAGGEGIAEVTVTVSDGQSNNATVSRSFAVEAIHYIPLIPFDDADDLNHYTTTLQNTTHTRIDGAGAGDPASGSVATAIVTAGSDAAVLALRNQTFSGDRLTELKTSLMLNLADLDDQVSGKSSAEIRFGFSAGTAINPAKPHEFFHKGSNPNRSIGIQFKAEHEPGSTDRKFEAAITNKSADGDASSSASDSATGSNFDQWVRITLTLTPTSSTGYAAGYVVEGLGSDGLQAPVEILSGSGTVTNAGLAASDEIRGAYAVRPDKNTTETFLIDNHVAGFTVDPTPTAPRNFTASDGHFSDRIRLTWNASPGATLYRVSRAVGFDAFSEIGTTTETSYDDFTAVRGQSYDYVVVAENVEGIGTGSDVDGGYVGVAIPSSLSSRYNRAGGSVVLSWSAVPGVSRFAVFRSGTGNFADAVEIGTANGLSYEDFAADGGSVYHYWIASIDGNEQRIGGTNAGLRALSGFLQPDLLVGAKPAKLIGGDRYNTNAAEQLLKLKSAKYKPAKVSIQLENDGQFTDSFFYRGSKTTRFFTLTFIRVTPASANLTAGMASGRAESSLLAVGGSETISVRITPNRKTQKKRSRPYLLKGRLTSESKTESGNLDTVGFDLTSSVK